MERTTEREIRCPYCDGLGEQETILTDTSISFKPTSVNLHLHHLKAMFGKAQAWKLCAENPAGIKPIREEKRPPSFIPPEAVPDVLRKISDPEVRAVVTAYLATGRRRSELFALEWPDVDLAKGRYYVRRSKTHLCSWFPINAAFRAVLEARVQDSGKVFRRWAHVDTISKVVKQALRAVGYGHLRLHDLRHGFSVMFLVNGGSIYTLKELLGHQQVSTTQIYSHLTNSHLADEVERVTFGPVAEGSTINKSVTRPSCRRSSGVEQLIRNQQVAGSTPIAGS